MKMWKWLLASCAVASLVACGGSVTSSSDPADPDDDTPTASSVELISSSNQVGTGGDQVTITAFVKGTGNVALADAPITFSADSGILTSAATVTDSAGVATATLAAGADRSNRTIAVRAISGAQSGGVSVLVAGTSLAIAGASTVPLGQSEVLTVKATDSKGAVIPGLEVAVSSRLGNGLSSTPVTTNAQGVATVTYSASTAGADTLSFTGGGATAASEIQISGENFAFVSPSPSTTIPVGTPTNVTVRYLLAGVPQAGKSVSFAATAGTVTPASGVTDASGQVTVVIASNSASPATVQATLANPVAQATLPVEFIATVPATLVLQVSPTALGPNPAGSTAQQAQALATVKDANGNPVKGATVNFNRVVDASGGNLNQVSAVTDSSGQASVQYIAGALSTASNGVTLRATVAGTSIAHQASLTVNQSALFIALGQGNQISNVNPTTYNKEWTVYVTDANGNPVSDVTLTLKALPNRYRKGELAWDGKAWSYFPPIYTCANEDTNFDGVLNPGEDTNGSGVLEPGNVILVTPGTVRTDSQGRATVNLQYAESYVPWVELRLRAEAVVQGTESSKQSIFWVEGLNTDFTNESIAPAGQVSPFGVNPCPTPN